MPSTTRIRRTRTRTIHSCVPCHTRKVKCDRGHPCRNCSARRREHECRYVTTTNSFSASAFSALNVVDSSPKTSNLKRSQQIQIRSSPRKNLVVQGTADSLHQVPGGRHDSPSASVPASAPDAGGGGEGGGREASGKAPRQLMFARHNKGKVRFKGPTHWSLLAAELCTDPSKRSTALLPIRLTAVVDESMLTRP